MRSRRKSMSWLGWLSLALAAITTTGPALGQDLPRVSVTRKLAVAGVGSASNHQDLLGISRIKFQGLIAAELSDVGFLIASPDEVAFERGDRAPLTLSGRIKEEICDDIEPSQCRIAISWELEDVKGRVVYRVLTRAVEQQASIDELRRGLVRGALHSLLKRRRFALQLLDSEARARTDAGPLGFKRCRRSTLALPAAARSAVAPMVWVESGSSLAAGSLISGDGLVLTAASSIVPDAPLRVRFSAQQTLAGEVVAIERRANVALVHVPVSTDTTCVPLGEDQLQSGARVFGVSSELSEDSAVSIDSSASSRVHELDGQRWFEVEARVAHVEGAPLLDEQAQLVAIVSSAGAKPSNDTGRALAIGSALAALNVKPAAVTDPRLLVDRGAPQRAIEYVGDRDDPPFALSRRYTYGTSPFARRLRTGSIVAAGIGALGVAGTWIAFRSNPQMSNAAHDRSVILNDLGWVLLGIGAVGIGGSFVWPEGHDVVAGRSATKRELFVHVAGPAVLVGGRI